MKGPDGQKYHLVDKGPYKAFYDRWGRLQRIEYDGNGDGRPDHVAHHDGRKRAYQLEVDLDFDGRTDRWEDYDAEGRLLKVGTAAARAALPTSGASPAPTARPRAGSTTRTGTASPSAWRSSTRGAWSRWRSTPTATAASTAGRSGRAAGWRTKSSTPTATAGATAACATTPAGSWPGWSRLPGARSGDGSFGAVLRVPILVLLAAAPLALGAVHEPAFVPLLAVATVAGLASWGRGHWARAHGFAVPPVAGARAARRPARAGPGPAPAAAARAAGGGQPGLPSPSTSGCRWCRSAWRPISVNPADTARGFAFLAGMSLLYAAVYREFGDERWRAAAGRHRGRRRLRDDAGRPASRSQSADPTRIYGLWKPRWDWGVFGPYVSRNHFAGYLAMAIPLALGFAAESAPSRCARSWRRAGSDGSPWASPRATPSCDARRRPWSSSSGCWRRTRAAGCSPSPLGVLALAALVRRGRRLVLPLAAALAVAALFWVDVSATRTAFLDPRPPAEPARALARRAAHGPGLPGPRRRLQRLRHLLRRVPDRRALRVVRRGAQRVPAGAGGHRGPGRGAGGRRCWSGCCGAACAPPGPPRSTPASSAPSPPAPPQPGGLQLADPGQRGHLRRPGRAWSCAGPPR